MTSYKLKHKLDNDLLELKRISDKIKIMISYVPVRTYADDQL